MAKLGWRRIAAGQYVSRDGAYRIARAVEGQRGEWRVTVTTDPCGEPIKRATLAGAKAAAESREAERLSRPVPASAFVEPSAKRAPVLDFEYEDEPEGCGYSYDHTPDDPESPTECRECGADLSAMESEPEADAVEIRADADFSHTATGPAVRLTPARTGHRLHAPDSDVLQLLAMLDAGVKATRSLYREWTVTGPDLPFRLDLAKVDGAAREAVRAGLAREAFVSGRFVLTAEPIHLAPHPDRIGTETPCGRYAGPNAIRLRVTSDPAKVTHDRCRPE